MNLSARSRCGSILLLFVALIGWPPASSNAEQSSSRPPRIDSVVMSVPQPNASHSATTRYNDFANLRWLGNRPASSFALHSTEESGRWVCVEARAKLNTPGQKDGLNQLWIDGRLEAERRDLDWRGSYDRHGINAVFLESYWNDGSPVDQSRWIDNFVIATAPIGPIVCPRNPELIRTSEPETPPGGSWHVEVATFSDSPDVVWSSRPIESGDRVRVDSQTGSFVGELAAHDRLAPNRLYQFRARQTAASGATSEWSRWHQTVRTTAE